MAMAGFGGRQVGWAVVVLVAAGGCTLALGIDKDYHLVDDGGVGGLGGMTTSSTSATTSSTTTTSSMSAGGTGGGTSSPGLGVLGQPCPNAGALACAGHAQKLQLVCGGDLKWTQNGTCGTGQLCDSTPGVNQGTCAPVVPACAAKSGGDLACDGLVRVQCGPDLVSTTTIETCPFVCTPSACTMCVPNNDKQCAENVPQTCDGGGQWQGTTACVGQTCNGGVCVGVCAPMDTKCVGNVPYSCDGNGAWQAGPACTATTEVCIAGACAPVCMTANECPGVDTECKQRTCTVGVCGFGFTTMGTAISQQTPGDCTQVVCDGAGNTSPVPADTDVPADQKDCMIRGCAQGVPTATPAATGATCMQGGGKVCTSASKCVQCLTTNDCTGGLVCNAMNVCVASPCNDAVKNGAESDVDCGGGTCPKCGSGKTCNVSADCASSTCTGGTCAASCTDLVKDGTETDVDCGGTCPTRCASGLACGADADCQSGKCTSNVCTDALLISQVQTRGDIGAGDEFVELYNPTTVPVTFDATWTLKSRSATGGLSSCASSTLSVRFSGGGQIIPPHGHILYTSTASPGYNGPTPGDGTYTVGITDASSVMLFHGNTVVDALCFYYDAATQAALTGCSTPYICEGTPVMNPHNNTTASNVDASLERKPGGALGNTQDSGDNAADFATLMPAYPRNSQFAPAP
jgi:hypothetical protein